MDKWERLIINKNKQKGKLSLIFLSGPFMRQVQGLEEKTERTQVLGGNQVHENKYQQMDVHVLVPHSYISIGATNYMHVD